MTQAERSARYRMTEKGRAAHARAETKRGKRVFTPEQKERRRMYYAENRERIRSQVLKRTYGITLDDYRERLEAQGNACALCRSTEPRGRGSFHVDHDPETGRVRGLLCHECNTGLGKLGDSVASLERAIDYLRAAQ